MFLHSIASLELLMKWLLHTLIFVSKDRPLYQAFFHSKALLRNELPPFVFTDLFNVSSCKQRVLQFVCEHFLTMACFVACHFSGTFLSFAVVTSVGEKPNLIFGV